MSDRLTAWVRTVTPKLWAALVTALLAWFAVHAPWALELLELIGVDLTSEVTIGFVILLVDGVVLAAWHWAWSRLQPHLPDGVVRLVLGSVKSPVYLAPGDAATVYIRPELGTLAGSAGDTPVPVAPAQSFGEAAALALDPTTRTVVAARPGGLTVRPTR